MAWGQPKRSGRGVCGHRGQCSCQRRTNAELKRNPAAAPTTCVRKCRDNKPCGRTARGGVCPCPYC